MTSSRVACVALFTTLLCASGCAAVARGVGSAAAQAAVGLAAAGVAAAATELISAPLRGGDRAEAERARLRKSDRERREAEAEAEAARKLRALERQLRYRAPAYPML